jgi:hypothetical protein
MNSDNPLLVVKQQKVDWRSEWVSPEVRNDKDRVIVMKMAGCSEGKRQDIRNYLKIYLSLKYCEVTCLSYSLRWFIKNVLKNKTNQDYSYFYYSNSSQSTKTNK